MYRLYMIIHTPESQKLIESSMISLLKPNSELFTKYYIGTYLLDYFLAPRRTPGTARYSKKHFFNRSPGWFIRFKTIKRYKLVKSNSLASNGQHLEIHKPHHS